MIFVADNKDGALLGFPTTVNGDASPSAVIAGSNTTISAQNQNGIPFSAILAFDGVGSLYTAGFEGTSAAVFPTGATGNVAPSSTLTGPDYIDAIAFDSAGNAYIAGPSSDTPSEPAQIDIFAKGAMGTAMPLATISGSATELNDPRAMAIDSSGNLYVINYPPAAAAVQILIFANPITNNGNVAPSAIISGNQTQLEYPNGLAFDSKGNLLVSDSKGAVLIFGKGSTGNATSTSLSGSDTDLGEPSGVAVDASDNIWVSDAGTEYIPAILEFAAGSSGNAIALKHIYGAATMINKPYQIVYVRGGNITTATSRKPSSHEGAPQRRP